MTVTLNHCGERLHAYDPTPAHALSEPERIAQRIRAHRCVIRDCAERAHGPSVFCTAHRRTYTYCARCGVIVERNPYHTSYCEPCRKAIVRAGRQRRNPSTGDGHAREHARRRAARWTRFDALPIADWIAAGWERWRIARAARTHPSVMAAYCTARGLPYPPAHVTIRTRPGTRCLLCRKRRMHGGLCAHHATTHRWCPRCQQAVALDGWGKSKTYCRACASAYVSARYHQKKKESPHG